MITRARSTSTGAHLDRSIESESKTRSGIVLQRGERLRQALPTIKMYIDVDRARCKVAVQLSFEVV